MNHDWSSERDHFCSQGDFGVEPEHIAGCLNWSADAGSAVGWRLEVAPEPVLPLVAQEFEQPVIPKCLSIFVLNLAVQNSIPERGKVALESLLEEETREVFFQLRHLVQLAGQSLTQQHLVKHMLGVCWRQRVLLEVYLPLTRYLKMNFA